MQTHAQCQWRSRCCTKALLTCGQTPTEFERHAHRAPGIVFLGHRHPEHGHKALAHHRMESSFILAYHVLGKGVEGEKQAMQGIEINTRSMDRCCGYRTAEHCDR